LPDGNPIARPAAKISDSGSVSKNNGLQKYEFPGVDRNLCPDSKVKLIVN
jgi:hypothetical protein